MKDLKFPEIENLFDDLIKPGILQETKEVLKGLVLTVRTLDNYEICVAENLAYKDNREAPMTVLQKHVNCRVLSMAIVEMNGVKIIDGDELETEIREKQEMLFINLMKTPSIVITKAFQFFLEVCQKQDQIYMMSDKLAEEIDSF